MVPMLSVCRQMSRQDYTIEQLEAIAQALGEVEYTEPETSYLVSGHTI